MKLKKGTLILVSLLAVFFVGLSSVSAQKLSDAPKGADELLSVESFETHVQGHIPAALLDYVVAHYQDFSMNQVKYLLSYVNLRATTKDSMKQIEMRRQLTEWINENIPPADSPALQAEIRQGDILKLSTSEQQ